MDRDPMERAIRRRMMLNDIERGRKEDATLLNKADDLQKKAYMIRGETDEIVKKLAEIDKGASR